MLGAQTRMLLRFVPRLTRFPPMQLMQLSSSSAYRSCISKMGTIACCQSGVLAQKETLGKPVVIPRRNLAGDHKDDYILHQNTLTETEKRDIESSVKKDFEDWVPYGFDPTNKEQDIFRYKLFLFTTLTLGVVVFLYFFYHLPPRNLREWVTREGYLEIERRQRLGLPLVDRNLIPADRVLLPSEEELGDDYEIII